LPFEGTKRSFILKSYPPSPLIGLGVFGVINILMRLAPIGAFGAMAFTIGRYGVASLGPLVRLIATFYVTCIFFVWIVLGGWWAWWSPPAIHLTLTVPTTLQNQLG
jgi:hypothetical protein